MCVVCMYCVSLDMRCVETVHSALVVEIGGGVDSIWGKVRAAAPV